MHIKIITKDLLNIFTLRSNLVNYRKCYLIIDRINNKVIILDMETYSIPLARIFIKLKVVKDKLIDLKTSRVIKPEILLLKIRIYLRYDIGNNIHGPSRITIDGNNYRQLENQKNLVFFESQLSISERFYVDEYGDIPVRPDLVKSYLINSNFNGLPIDNNIDTLIFLSWISSRTRIYNIKLTPSKDEFGLKRITYRIYNNLDQEFIEKHLKGLVSLPFFRYGQKN